MIEAPFLIVVASQPVQPEVPAHGDPAIYTLLRNIVDLIAADYGVATLESEQARIELAGISHLPDHYGAMPAQPVGSGQRPRGEGPDLAIVEREANARLSFELGRGVRLELNVGRRGQPIGSAARKLRSQMPWIRDFVRLWWSARTVKTYAEHIERALNAMPGEVIIVGADCRVVALNPAASAMLAANNSLGLAQGRLSASTVEDDIRLKTVVCHAARDPTSGGRSHTRVMKLARARQRPLILAVSASGCLARHDDPTVLVQVVDPEIDLAQHVGLACDIYGIVGSEARLARLLVGGHSLVDAAAMLKIQPDTARTYLKQMFAKTGVNRQILLVQLLLASTVREAPGAVLRLV